MGNGEVHTLPTIHISWDAEHQAVVVDLNQSEFKTFEFIIAVLDMAKQQMDTMKRTAQVQNMQRAQQQAMQAQAIKSNLRLG